jgi:hypothetical protein
MRTDGMLPRDAGTLRPGWSATWARTGDPASQPRLPPYDTRAPQPDASETAVPVRHPAASPARVSVARAPPSAASEGPRTGEPEAEDGIDPIADRAAATRMLAPA